MKALILLTMTLFAIYSFALIDETPGVQYPEPKLIDLADSLAGCGHNGTSLAGTFKLETFRTKNFIAALKIKNGSCYRKYSTSRPNAIGTYRHHVSKDNEDRFSSYSCVDKHIKTSSEKLIEYMNDPQTISVVSDIFDTKTADKLGGTSEDCAYYNFYVFRKSGTVLKVEFNYTD